MSARWVVPVAVAALVAAGAWLALRPPQLPTAEVAAVAEGPGAGGGRAAPSPAAAAPVTGSRPATGPARAGGSPSATLFGEFLEARDYRALYDRLQGSPEGATAEGKLVLWELLRECATITEGRRYTPRQRTPKRDEFIATLAPSDPLRERRIAAYDAFHADKCAGFEGVSLTQAALDGLLRDAAAAGDPRARAMAIEQELWIQRRTAGRDAATLSDAQIESLKDALSTRDPEVIRVAGRVLSNSWADYALRIGPDQSPVEPRPFMNAWLVLACEYGQPCGADTPRMQQACALRGHCDAQSYPDYLAYYASTPHDSQLLTQYRALLRQAIETGDWSQFSVVRGLPPANRVTFVPGPR